MAEPSLPVVVPANTGSTADKPKDDASSPPLPSLSPTAPSVVRVAPTNKWQRMQGIGAITAVGAFIILFFQLRNFSKQVENTSTHLKLLEKSGQQNAFTTIYAQGHSVTKVFLEHPELREYFYKDSRKNGMIDDDLRKEFASLRLNDPLKHARILMACEMLGDFFEQAYTQRTVIPGHDWNGWWNYFCDAWDESPILRDYFNGRDDWYTVTEFLRPVDAQDTPILDAKKEKDRDPVRTKQKRIAVYEGEKNRRL